MQAPSAFSNVWHLKALVNAVSLYLLISVLFAFSFHVLDNQDPMRGKFAPTSYDIQGIKEMPSL